MSLTVRPARSSDEELPRVVGGREAAPEEWAEWAEEPGHDLVAEDGGRVVGAIHVSIVGRTEAWMENLRVLAGFQGRGIAGRLVREAEHLAVQYGAATLRTAIPSHDYAALAVAHRGGYKHALQCVVLETAITAEPRYVPYDAPVESPDVSAATAVATFVGETRTMQAWEQLVPLGWRFRRILPELVRGLVKDGRALVALRPDALRPGMRNTWRAGDLQGAVLFGQRNGSAVISLLEGTSPAMQALYGTVTEPTRTQRRPRTVVFAPTAEALAPLHVQEWAPHPWCPDGMVVVEKSVAS